MIKLALLSTLMIWGPKLPSPEFEFDTMQECRAEALRISQDFEISEWCCNETCERIGEKE